MGDTEFYWLLKDIVLDLNSINICVLMFVPTEFL